MKTLITVLLAIAICACCMRGCSGEDGIVDSKATARLSTEINLLQKEKPIKNEVSVVVWCKTIYGFYRPDPTTGHQIVIIDKGDRQNIKTLRHEWEHARQREAGRPYDEREAYAAEDAK